MYYYFLDIFDPSKTDFFVKAKESLTFGKTNYY